MWLELILLGLAALVLRHWLATPRDLPPGPLVIPYLGSLPVYTIQQVKEYRKKYGDIFKAELGPWRLVFLCNYKVIKEAFSRPEVSHRPDMKMLHFLTDGVEAGVTMASGQHWQNSRRFLLRNLRDLGMGKTSLEKDIQREARALVEDFRSSAGSPTLFPDSINVAVLNVLWQLVASKRYELHDEEVLNFAKAGEAFQANPVVMLLFAFPGLKKIIPSCFRKRWMNEDAILALKNETHRLVKELTAAHRDTLDPDNPRDIVDEYLLAMDSNAEIATFFSDTDLTKVIFDLFFAGFDTTANMLRWIILYMAKFPEVQRRVQRQIDDVVPQDSLPSCSHKQSLPLVNAMINEVLRMASFLPLGVQHSAQAHVHLEGYFIPKGTIMLGCAVCCHEDPQHWEQPEQFQLERFLDSEGNFVHQREGFLPFGIGRRSCLGESLARMELFLFSTALLGTFSFSVPQGSQVDLEPDNRQPGFQQPKEQSVVITVRKAGKED